MTFPFAGDVPITVLSREVASDLEELSCSWLVTSFVNISAKSHSRTNLSLDPEAMRTPSGEHATDVIALVCVGSQRALATI